MSSDPNCIFCKIVAGQIPSRKVYEDDELLAFHDIAPWAPVHRAHHPKRHIASMADVTEAEEALLGKMMVLGTKLMKELGVTGGFRHVVNTGRDGGQEVSHAPARDTRALGKGLSGCEGNPACPPGPQSPRLGVANARRSQTTAVLCALIRRALEHPFGHAGLPHTRCHGSRTC